jgi:hypothetical protein
VVAQMHIVLMEKIRRYGGWPKALGNTSKFITNTTKDNKKSTQLHISGV